MAIIELTRDYRTTVDDDRYKELDSYLWYASGNEGRPARRLRTGPRKLIYLYHQVLHVLPWVLRDMGLCVDHIDGNPLNNTKINLRVVSQSENMMNSARHQFRDGIGYDSTHDRYKAYIDMPFEKRINIGTYLTKEEATTAVMQARKEMGL